MRERQNSRATRVPNTYGIKTITIKASKDQKSILCFRRGQRRSAARNFQCAQHHSADQYGRDDEHYTNQRPLAPTCATHNFLRRNRDRPSRCRTRAFGSAGTRACSWHEYSRVAVSYKPIFAVSNSLRECECSIQHRCRQVPKRDNLKAILSHLTDSPC
jgi:hypothetical protein